MRGNARFPSSARSSPGCVRLLLNPERRERIDFRQSGDISTVAAELVINDPVLLRFDFQ